ncbi:MAG: ABC-F family ATP-binding cassette domain-containing protein [Alphaproteobacteria bacterium]|nr:ABC-F family ATP-binding cassette domain-containing protein [Alphaproteobacteria bacterium]
MLRLENAVVSAGGNDLLVDAELHIRPGDRIGLVGRNGAGKTTLLRVLLGQVDLDRGTLHKRRDLRFGYLPQQAVEGSQKPVWDECRAGMVRLVELQADLERAQRAVEAGEDGAVERLATAESSFQIGGGYAWDQKVGTVLHGLGFEKDVWTKPCAELSGGWQMRTALAKLLLSEPDVAFLDEPTNHLDLHARTWLAEALRTAPWTTVLVSHDRHLLDRVATRIVEVRNKRLYSWAGNFSRFLVAREEQRAQQEAEKRRVDAELDHLQSFVDRFGAKATKATQAKSRAKRIDKIERIELEREPSLPRMQLPEPPASAQRMVRLAGVDVGWPEHEPLIRGLDLEIERGMRVALIGDNGSGKSTLLKTLSGELLPLAGRRYPGDRLRMGVFHQDLAAALDPDATGLEVVTAQAPLLDTAKVRGILGALGLSGDAALRPIRALSGGEKARVALASLTAKPHNLLLLDEPTNHLDAETVEVLVRALKDWTGALVLVSHDRYVVEQLATHVLRLDSTCLLKEGVDPSDFERTSDSAAVAVDRTKRTDYADRKRLQRELERARKRLDALPADLERAEADVERVDAQLVDAAEDWARATELGTQRQAHQARVDGLFEEWEALEAEIARLEAELC